MISSTPVDMRLAILVAAHPKMVIAEYYRYTKVLFHEKDSSLPVEQLYRLVFIRALSSF
jgi:hypothetical protein